MVRCRECGDAVTDGRGGYRLCRGCSVAWDSDGADICQVAGHFGIGSGVVILLVELAASEQVDDAAFWRAAIHVAMGLGLLRAARRKRAEPCPSPQRPPDGPGGMGWR